MVFLLSFFGDQRTFILTSIVVGNEGRSNWSYKRDYMGMAVGSHSFFPY